MKPINPITDKAFETQNRSSAINLELNGVERRYGLIKEMPASKFLKIILIGVIAGMLVITGINAWIDIYGLFRPANNRNLPIYYNERVSKFLLSYHYIPQQFNTVIIGTSLSANLDITDFNHKQNAIKIYNASIMGANISELRPMVDNLIHGGIKKMIICFSPYMIKNSGSKEVEFGPKLYIGALGSKNLFDTYVVGVIRHFNLLPRKFPKDQIDEYGVNHFSNLYKVADVKEKIALVIRADKELTVDPVALQELKEFVNLLKTNNIQFVGYFHPIPAEVLASKRVDYDKFEKTVREFVGDDKKLINFNTKDFEAFTTNYTNYVDHGHLSVKGQRVISAIVVDELIQRYGN